eukprot:scaffold74411_cov24-Phaeocystis_antarctica.AAC.1
MPDGLPLTKSDSMPLTAANLRLSESAARRVHRPLTPTLALIPTPTLTLILTLTPTPTATPNPNPTLTLKKQVPPPYRHPVTQLSPHQARAPPPPTVQGTECQLAPGRW